MRSLRQSLFVITALLLCACGTGYDYKPSSVDCNALANYNVCHFITALLERPDAAVVEVLPGGGGSDGWARTTDLGIMSAAL